MDVTAVINFVDPPSVMITLGGTVAATLFAQPLPKVITAFKAVKNITKPKKLDPH